MRRICSIMKAGILGSLLFLFTVTAKGQLPLATFELAAYGAVTVFAPGTLYEARGPTTATITQGLDPYVSAGMAYPNPPAGTIFATSASFDYYFEVSSSTSGTALVTFMANGGANMNNVNQGTAEAYFDVGTVSGGEIVNFLDERALTSSSTATASFTLDESLSVPLNTEEEVQIYAGVSDYGNGASGTPAAAIGSASVDPQISLAPGQLGETLIFSSNFLPVPEPSSEALLVLGSMAFLCIRQCRSRFWN